MNMFRQSELNDDELIQANRLEEAIDHMFQSGESGIDEREDPELSALTSVGSLLRASSDEATSRDSFHSFHMRSRSALLHRVSESRESSHESDFLGSVRHFIRVRSTILSGVGASLVTAFAFLLVSNLGGGSNPTTEVTNVANTDNSTFQVAVKNQEKPQGQLALTTVSSGAESVNDVMVDTSQSRLDTAGITTTGSSVVAIQQSPYSLSINSLVSAIEALESANLESNISVDVVRQVTDELAKVGFEMRSGHPGAKEATDIEDFQNAIARAIVVLQGIEQSDENVQASLIAAKIVAEEGIYIATMYVNANKASR